MKKRISSTLQKQVIARFVCSACLQSQQHERAQILSELDEHIVLLGEPSHCTVYFSIDGSDSLSQFGGTFASFAAHSAALNDSQCARPIVCGYLNSAHRRAAATVFARHTAHHKHTIWQQVHTELAHIGVDAADAGVQRGILRHPFVLRMSKT